MLDSLAQAGIVIFGIISVILLVKRNKWGFIHGLLAEFFTVISAALNNQGGIVLISVVQAFIWLYAIYNWLVLQDKTGV